MSAEDQGDMAASFCEQLTPELMDALISNGTDPDELFMHYWWCSPESVIHWAVKTFTAPVMIVIGSIGNALAFVVLSRKMLKQWSVCFYLSLYAIINTAVLYIGCGLDWVSYLTQTAHVANQADWICRLWKFFFNVLSYSSIWVVVAMTMDRFVLMWYPRKAHQLCTVFMAKLVAIFIFVGLVVISIHAMWTYALTAHGCIIDSNKDTHAFQTIAWPMASAIMYSYLPVVLIFTMDIFLVLGMVSPTSRADTNPSQNRLTRAVLAVSIIFLLLYLPTVIVNILLYSQQRYFTQIHLRVRLSLLQEICQTLACLNNAISFILYFSIVPAMRQELVDMVNVLRATRHPTNEELQTVDTNGSAVVKQDAETSVTLL